MEPKKLVQEAGFSIPVEEFVEHTEAAKAVMGKDESCLALVYVIAKETEKLTGRKLTQFEIDHMIDLYTALCGTYCYACNEMNKVGGKR